MLPEQIYTLRRKHGLSQEQLAEKLGVSRQTVSKWETGLSTPDLPKLLALSECFGVSLAELATGQAAAPTETREAREAAPFSWGKAVAGLTLSLLGAAMLLLTGVLLAAMPGAAEALNASSAVTLQGSGLLLLLGVLCLAAGVLLLLRKK